MNCVGMFLRHSIFKKGNIVLKLSRMCTILNLFKMRYMDSINILIDEDYLVIRVEGG